jgi:tetratricopeptide (TPR) repeat protein
MHISASTDMWAQMLWRQVRAKVLARSGELGEAQRLALEAVAIADDTELLDMQGAAYSDLGEVLLLTGKADEATAAFEQALARYKRKGNLVMADRTQARLAELRQSAVAAQRT